MITLREVCGYWIVQEWDAGLRMWIYAAAGASREEAITRWGQWP